MSELNLKTETAGAHSPDALTGLPALPAVAAIGTDTHPGRRGSALRRRLGARMLQPFDDGLRPFRVY